MGALHDGHLELVRTGKRLESSCLVSIFVNPTQFAPGEDLSRYPRPLERDLELAATAGADAVWVPEVADLYGANDVWVEVEGVSAQFEGVHRPTHFRGVATVVAKLFGVTQPTRAIFGLKDLQQCAVIRALVKGLFLPISLEFVETIRESDGLALSSRNQYLTPEERAIAPSLYRVLTQTSQQVHSSLRSEDVEGLLRLAISELTKIGFTVDYLDWTSIQTLLPIRAWEPESRLVAAARIGSVRLIDNVAVGP